MESIARGLLILSMLSGGMVGLGVSFGLAAFVDMSSSNERGGLCWAIGAAGTFLGTVFGLLILLLLH